MAKDTKKDAEMAARMKREGVERTTYRCCNCYKIAARESIKSKNTHIMVCQG